MDYLINLWRKLLPTESRMECFTSPYSPYPQTEVTGWDKKQPGLYLYFLSYFYRDKLEPYWLWIANKKKS